LILEVNIVWWTLDVVGLIFNEEVPCRAAKRHLSTVQVNWHNHEPILVAASGEIRSELNVGDS
jgi:hypothetical protein